MAKTKAQLKALVDACIAQQGNQSGLDGLDEILNELIDAAFDSGAASVSAMIAPAYSAASTYAKDALVTHEGKLYKAKDAIGTAEAWTAAHWDETTLAAVISA